MLKIKVFLWKLYHKGQPLRCTLLRRGLNIDPICPIYLGDIESVEHPFKYCQIVSMVWEANDKHHWLPLSVSPTGCKDISQSLSRIQASHNPKLKQKFLFLLWRIWKSRNATIFKNKIFNPLGCLIRAKKANVE